MSINLSHLKKLIATMIPILIAQVSTVGMNFMDSTMSGHVSANDLAGVSIGASLFLPIQTTAMGLLTAATPMAAQLMGKKEKEGIPMIIRTGLYLALLLSFLFALLYYLLIDTVLEGLSLAPAVSSIAKDYMLALVGAFLFEMLAMPLRSLTDTVGATTISMRLFLLALPVNGLLNYAFIFGKWGAPALGGVGAGIATLLTYVFLVLLFLAVILSHKPFMGRALFSSPESRLFVWKEYMALGIPNALGVFMETSLFGFIIIFITKFGTETIAAHQAALNFSGIIYMIPMSCSMAMTILVGYESERAAMTLPANTPGWGSSPHSPAQPSPSPRHSFSGRRSFLSTARILPSLRLAASFLSTAPDGSSSMTSPLPFRGSCAAIRTRKSPSSSCSSPTGSFASPPVFSSTTFSPTVLSPTGSASTLASAPRPCSSWDGCGG